ncbi:MAG: DUF4350 domain-containing protein [Sphingomonas sp.]
MSDVPIGRRSDAAFQPLTVALILVIGVLGFLGTLVLGAYGPDLHAGHDSGGHALSKSAVGFAGLVQLAQATGHPVHIVRDPHQWGDRSLLIATPPNGVVDVSGLGSMRQPTLIVLPKWQTVDDRDQPGWVRIERPIDADEPEGVLAPADKLAIARLASGGRPLVRADILPPELQFDAPQPVQVITSARLEKQVIDGREEETEFSPLITDGNGHTVLARIGAGPLYVLADPDLLDNAGLKSLAHARAAIALIDWLGSSANTRRVDFDVTLNGLGATRNPLQLAFQPPFLAMTLAIAAALLLLGVHALARFGAPRPRERAIAFGKAALVDNTAMLVRKAGRAHRLGGRYAAVVRDRAVRAFGVSPRLKGTAIDGYLDGLGGGARFTDLAATAETADDDPHLLAAARALHDWQQEKLG